MHMSKHLRATSDRLFPHARKAERLTEEDAFMQLHGGKGARLIYWAVCQTETAGNAVWCLLRGREAPIKATQQQDACLGSKCVAQKSSSRLASAVMSLRTRP